MTNQEAFDRMMNHLRSLKERSTEDSGSLCVYNGAKCAVGALMTEEEQKKFGYFEGSVTTLLDYMAGNDHKSELHALDGSMLEYVQCLHDYDRNWSLDGFKAEPKAEKIAEQFGLVYTAPETAN